MIFVFDGRTFVNHFFKILKFCWVFAVWGLDVFGESGGRVGILRRIKNEMSQALCMAEGLTRYHSGSLLRNAVMQ